MLNNKNTTSIVAKNRAQKSLADDLSARNNIPKNIHNITPMPDDTCWRHVGEVGGKIVATIAARRSLRSE